MYHRLVPLILLVLTIYTTACSKKNRQEELHFYHTWQEILHRDTLRVGTMTSPTDFYIYRGQQFGWEYTKVQDFARAHSLVLDIFIANSIDSLQYWVSKGKIDISITPLSMTQEYQEAFRFCGVEQINGLVVVQNKGRGKRVTELSQLFDKQVYALDNSVEALRLEQIRAEMGAGQSMVQLVDTLGVEELLLKIAEGDAKIQYAIANAYLASIYAKYLPQLDCKVKASIPMRYNWFVHKANSTLQEAVDLFFRQEERQVAYEQLLHNDRHIAFYFKDVNNDSVNGVYNREDGTISPYDTLFQEEAKRIGWPWTILASIAFQESHFHADIIGWSGARGLMGIMPATGRLFGATIDELLHPEVSVRVAVDCLLTFQKSYTTLPTPEDILCFTLASYNAGSGHIFDARRLAQKYGAPHNQWYGGVREYLLLKSNPTYYNDPVVRFGYVRGRETTKYVDDVLERHMAYQAQIK